MRRVLLIAGLLAALASGDIAAAQYGGRGRGEGSDGSRPRGAPPAAPPVAADQVVITGVVVALGPEPDRVTIAYGAVDALNWPAGSTPFVVTNPALLNGIAVGQRVRFKIESAHIYALERVM